MTALALTTMCYTSCEVGKRQSRDPDYAVFRHGTTAYLAATKLDVQHEIRAVGNDIYLGDLEHQLDGTRVLATMDADSLAARGKSVKPVLDKIVDRLTEALK